MDQSLTDGGDEQQYDETRPVPVENCLPPRSFVFGHATANGKPTNLNARIEIVIVK